MKWIALIVAMLIATPAWGLNVLEDKPLTKKDVQELLMLAILLEAMKGESVVAVAKGKEKPFDRFIGMRPRDIYKESLKRTFRKWAEQYKAEMIGAASRKKAPAAPPPAGPDKEIRAGGGFYVRNTSIKGGSFPEIIGEAVNKSGRNYQMAIFQIGLYDKRGRLIGTTKAMVQNFPNGSVRPFEAPISDVKAEEIAEFKIQFETGM